MLAAIRFSAQHMQRLKELHAEFCEDTAIELELAAWTATNIHIFKNTYPHVDIQANIDQFIAWLDLQAHIDRARHPRH
jgi:hypothetical protein